MYNKSILSTHLIPYMRNELSIIHQYERLRCSRGAELATDRRPSASLNTI